MKKVLRSRSLAILLVAGLTIGPAKQAAAWIPTDYIPVQVVAIVGAVATAVAAGVSAGAAWLAGVPVAVGMEVGYIAFCPTMDFVSGDSSCSEIDVGNGVSTVSAPATTSSTLTGPSGYSFCWVPALNPSADCYTGVFNKSSSLTSAAEPYCYSAGGTNFSAGTGQCELNGAWRAFKSLGAAPSPECPAGYEVANNFSGPYCTLVDAEQANPDSKRRYKRNGTAFTVNINAQNTGSDAYHPLVMTVNNSNDTVAIGGRDASGRIVAGFVTNNGTGTTITLYRDNGNGTTSYSQTELDANGTVTQFQDGNLTGGLVLPADPATSPITPPVTNPSDPETGTPASGVGETEVLGSIPAEWSSPAGDGNDAGAASAVGMAECLAAGTCGGGMDGLEALNPINYFPEPTTCTTQFQGACMTFIGIGEKCFPDICANPYFQNLRTFIDWAAGLLTLIAVFGIAFPTMRG